MKRSSAILSMFTLVWVLFAGSGFANAAPPASVTTLSVVGESAPGNSATLSMTFATPASHDQIEVAVTHLGVDPSTLTFDGTTATAGSSDVGVMTTQASGPSPGQRLPCGSGNTWADSQGLFNLQHQCGGTTIPWSWRMNSNLRASVVGLVTEQGMDWWRNGAQMKRMSPHAEAPDYYFHGTFSSSPTGTSLSYHDVFSWRHNIAGGGNAVVTIGGSFSYYKR